MLFIISASASARAAALPLSIVMTRVLPLPPPDPGPAGPVGRQVFAEGADDRLGLGDLVRGAPQQDADLGAVGAGLDEQPGTAGGTGPAERRLERLGRLGRVEQGERDELDGRVRGGVAAPLEDGGDVEVVRRVGKDHDRVAAGHGADRDHLRGLVPGLQDLDEGFGGPGRDVVDHGTRGAADRTLLLAVRPDVDLLEHQPGGGQLVGRAGDQDGVGPLRDDDLDALRLRPDGGGGHKPPVAVAVVVVAVSAEVLRREPAVRRRKAAGRPRLGRHLTGLDRGVLVGQEGLELLGGVPGGDELALVGESFATPRAGLQVVQIVDDVADVADLVLDDDVARAERTDVPEVRQQLGLLDLRGDRIGRERLERDEHLDHLGPAALRELIDLDLGDQLRRHLQVGRVQGEGLLAADQDELLVGQGGVEQVDRPGEGLVVDREGGRPARLLGGDLVQPGGLGEPRQDRVPGRLVELLGEGLLRLGRFGGRGRRSGRRLGDHGPAQPGHEHRRQPAPQSPERDTHRTADVLDLHTNSPLARWASVPRPCARASPPGGPDAWTEKV
jgi:hypothetical protein